MFLAKFNQQSYALFRIMTGFLFLWHGAQKLFGYPAVSSHDMPVFIVYVAGPIELVGGVLVMIGLFTRYAAFLCSGLSAAAYWMVHGTKAFFPLLNGGELAALYSFAFLLIATHGAGIWSIDKE
ncbi:MAG TPA: DoxX family protein [Acidiferrobacteraceae bacterium]|nr:DoxX family protein [Acidiferrobacteraceae bacterium]